MTFADNLVRLRREKGFSQEQLADLMDVSRQAVLTVHHSLHCLILPVVLL